MYTIEDLITISGWIIGILAVIILVDFCIIKPRQESKRVDKIIRRLRHTNKHFYKTLPNFNSRGIVLIVSDHNVLRGALSIVTLRRNGCQLPIAIPYTNSSLRNEHQQMLSELTGVTLMNLKSLPFPIEHSKIRVYGLIYSPFKEVLLIEADLLFARNPEHLFESSGFVETGALFWKDRYSQKLGSQKISDWTRRLIPYRKGDNRILNRDAGDYQSGSLLLFDKSRHLKTLEKLAVLMKEWGERYSYTPDIKESFWIASEIAKEPYAFVQFYPGAIGEMYGNLLWGHNLHLDPHGEILAWDGSLFNSSENDKITDFSHFARFEDGAEWAVGQRYLNAREYHPLSGSLLNIINEYKKTLQELEVNKNLIVD